MDNLQHQRFELKYLVDEKTASAVRDYVSSFLILDKFGAKQPDLSYPIHSLYLDSDDLAFYWQTINGNKNRYKLRLRYYDDNPAKPVFFEIKRRMNNAILKERGGVARDAVAAVLAGQLPALDQMASAEPGQVEALEHFCRLMQHHQARPKAHVAYRREAWISSQDNSARVTMDRQVRFAFEPAVLLSTEMKDPLHLFSNVVVLELKFTARYPDWFADLVRCFNLWQSSAAKYADGVATLTESTMSPESMAAQAVPETQERLRSRLEALKKTQPAIEPVFP
jgi:VTC domain